MNIEEIKATLQNRRGRVNSYGAQATELRLMLNAAHGDEDTLIAEVERLSLLLSDLNEYQRMATRESNRQREAERRAAQG